MNEAKELVNGAEAISNLQMIKIIETFRSGLQDVVYDLRDIDAVGENDWHETQNIPNLLCVDWGLDVLIKTLASE